MTGRAGPSPDPIFLRFPTVQMWVCTGLIDALALTLRMSCGARIPCGRSTALDCVAPSPSAQHRTAIAIEPQLLGGDSGGAGAVSPGSSIRSALAPMRRPLPAPTAATPPEAVITQEAVAGLAPSAAVAAGTGA